MLKQKFLIILITLVGLAMVAGPAWAQTETPLSLSLSKDFGYSGFAGDIQGAFSMRVKDPENLARVVFFIDGQPIGEVSSPPFRLQFDTGSYALGKHTLSATGYTSDGQELQSEVLTREFVAASAGAATVGKIIFPILGVVAGAALLAYLIPALLGRGKTKTLAPGATRSYAPLGGAVCPSCGRPFAIHIYGLNLLVGKLDRCPYCGKWSLVHRAGPAELRAAEQAEIELSEEAGPTVPEASAEEKLRRDLENSKYHAE
jgi:ribosomal protein L32